MIIIEDINTNFLITIDSRKRVIDLIYLISEKI